MIIYIDLKDGCLDAQNKQAIYRLLHEISDIYIKGRHYIVMNRRCSSWIIENMHLGETESTVIKNLYSEYTTSKAVVASATVFLEVNDIDSELSLSGAKYSIGLNNFISNKYFEAPHLLVENKIADGDFLNHILHNLARRRGLGRLSFEIVHGGGADMPALYERALKDIAISICIADSDKAHPADKESDKCRKIRKCREEHGVGITDFFQLPCHEAENLIPWVTFQHMTMSAGERKSIDVLQQIEAAEEHVGVPLKDRLRIYFNFKKGWDPANTGSAKYRYVAEFINLKLQMIGLSASTCALEGFGDRLTSRVLKEGKAASALCINILSCKYWNEIFAPPLLKLCSLLVSSNPRPAM